MAELTTLREAVSELVRDGQALALEGFTHLIPHAAGHELIRQGRKDLTLIRMTPDVVYDQLIGMGCARKLVFSWGGNPGVGSLHRFRDAVEHGWPKPIEIEEYSHAAMASAYTAGAAGLPFAIFRGAESDLSKVNPMIRRVECPFTGEELAAVPSHRPDVTVIHAQQADRRGNVLIWGIVGVQKEAVLAAKQSIVTVEEIVDEVVHDAAGRANSVLLPHWVVTAVCEAPDGAHPSYAQGYTRRDNAFYQSWETISRHRDTFADWMRRHVVETVDVGEYRASLRPSTDA
ncbi:MAG TPA: CoA-transferase [Vicinamibacteria bacterium]|jgi:glutaconate CoA-transferase subunit A